MTGTLDLKQIHDELHKSINDIDAVLDSLGDQKTASRKKITDEMIENTEPTWNPVADQLISQLSGQDIEVQIGVYFGLIRTLNEKFQGPLREALDTMVENTPAPEKPDLTEEQVKELQKNRSDMATKLKALFEMAQQFDQAEGMKLPAKRYGSKGPRGPRAINFVVWNIDGKEYAKLAEVVEDYDQYAKVSELTKAMKESGINLTKPPAEIQFQMPDGRILVGTNTAPNVTDNLPETEDDDDESADDES